GFRIADGSVRLPLVKRDPWKLGGDFGCEHIELFIAQSRYVLSVRPVRPVNSVPASKPRIRCHALDDCFLELWLHLLQRVANHASDHLLQAVVIDFAGGTWRT